MRAKAEEADRLIRARKDVRYTYITLGDPTSSAVDVGQIYVRLAPKGQRKLGAEADRRRDSRASWRAWAA